MEVAFDDREINAVVRHLKSCRILQFKIEQDSHSEDPDALYGSLWIAEGPEQDDEWTFIWDTEVRLASNERIEGGWETPSDMTGTPSLRGEGDWGRQVELYGDTRNTSSFIKGAPRTTTFLEWGCRGSVPFIQVVNVPPPDQNMTGARLQFEHGRWTSQTFED
jgi:hypothetical protein